MGKKDSPVVENNSNLTWFKTPFFGLPRIKVFRKQALDRKVVTTSLDNAMQWLLESTEKYFIVLRKWGVNQECSNASAVIDIWEHSQYRYEIVRNPEELAPK